MPTVELTQNRQDALRALIALEPTPGMFLPPRSVLRVIARLIPSDVVGVVVVDHDGVVRGAVTHPRGVEGPWQAPLRGHPVGLLHQRRLPEVGPRLSGSTMTDSVSCCFERDRGHVVRLSLHRRRHLFLETDVALLRAVVPALQRVIGGQPGIPLPTSLTAQERRVLSLVAAGLSNASVAARISVAECTVRKHLEHAFRKLGVSNRYAAVRAFEDYRSDGSPTTDQDRIFA